MNILQDAIDTYGTDNQLMVAVEELSELQKEICKAFRGMLNEQSLIEEIADAEIMIEQVMMIYDIKDEDIKTEKKLKLKRLKERLYDHWKG